MFSYFAFHIFILASYSFGTTQSFHAQQKSCFHPKTLTKSVTNISSRSLSVLKHDRFLSKTRNYAKSSDIDDSDSLPLGVVGVTANLICGYSLYVLKTTGCGLPAGDYGIEGAAEGISYLVVVGIFAYSFYTKIKTGSGLEAGKYGLVGLAEGLSFLIVLGGIVIAGLNLSEYGFLPGFLPNDQCFGVNSS